MNEEKKYPEFKKKSFVCPFCNALAQQEWGEYSDWLDACGSNTNFLYDNNIKLCRCYSCKEVSIWKKEKMIFPKKILVDLAHKDMPKSVKELYNEAREVSVSSSRAAAALLRVSLEKLTEELGEISGNLNIRIGNLKKQGLPERVIKSLDIVRINSNEGGAHSGEIDLSGKDGSEIVNRLFSLVNFIVEKTITENKEMDEMFDDLPENKKDGIKNRDNKKQ